MRSFLLYAVLTLASTAAAVYHAKETRRFFFPAAIYLTTSKINVMILANLGFFLTWVFGQGVKRLFLGKLDRTEVHELVSNAKFAVTETCLALTLFRNELDMRVLALFTLLIFLKVFHWLGRMRVEKVAREHELPARALLRLAFFLVVLIASDCAVVATLLRAMGDRPSVLLLFAFEHTVLALAAGSSLFKLGVLVYDARRGGRWEHKPLAMFVLQFVYSLARLVLSLAFFAVFCMYYGVPLHLIRDIYFAYHALFECTRKYLRYRRLTRDMDRLFPDATEAELDAGDRTCIVCREDMEAAKKLPCGHFFHAHCLRTWFERSHSCPTCRAVPATDAAAAGAGAGAGAAAAAAAAAAPAAAAAAPAAAAAAPAPVGAQPFAAPAAFRPMPFGAAHLPPEAREQFPTLAAVRQGPDGPLVRASDALALSQAHTLQLQSMIGYLEAQLAHAHAMLEAQLELQEQLHELEEGAEAADEAAGGEREEEEEQQKENEEEDGKEEEEEEEKKAGPTPPEETPTPRQEGARRPAVFAGLTDAGEDDDKADADDNAAVWGGGAAGGSSASDDSDAPPLSRPESRSSAADADEIRRRRLERFSSTE